MAAMMLLPWLAQTSPGGGHAALVTLICLAAVTLVALLVLSFNELRARGRRPRSAGQARKAARGLPKGKIVYQDADGTGEPLLSPRHPLSGKPDYVILSPEGVPIPVELKLSVTSDQPQDHHLMQLAAYFVILEDLYLEGVYDQPPFYGVLRYANKDCRIDYTRELQARVEQRLKAMARCDEDHAPKLTEQFPAKCHACPFQPICPIGRRQEG